MPWKMMRLVLPALLAVLLVPSLGRGQEKKVDLRGPEPKKGQIINRTEKGSLKNGKVAIDDGAMQISLDLTSKHTAENKVEIKEVKDGKIQKATLTVRKDETILEIGLEGKSKEDKKKGEFAGETLLFERTKDGWKKLIADKDLTDEQKEKLADVNVDDWITELLPKEEVAVGHKWEPKVESLKILFGSEVSKPSGKIKAHFKAIEKVDGEECAVIEFDMDVKGEKQEKKETIKQAFKGKTTEYRSLKTGVNRKSVVDGEIDLEGKTPDGANVKITGKLTGLGTAEVK